MIFWINLFWPQPVTREMLGHLDGDPGFRPPRFDPASDIAQGGTGRKERR